MLPDKRKPVTDRQLHLLWHITSYQREIGVSPSIVELAGMMGVATKTVREKLNALRAKGYVTWLRNQHRTIRLIDSGVVCENGTLVMENACG